MERILSELNKLTAEETKSLFKHLTEYLSMFDLIECLNESLSDDLKSELSVQWEDK